MALSKGVKKMIETYVQNQYQGDPNAFLFKSRKWINQPIGRVQAWKIMSDAAEELGLENIGTHSLRKTFWYHQIKRGTNTTFPQTKTIVEGMSASGILVCYLR